MRHWFRISGVREAERATPDGANMAAQSEIPDIHVPQPSNTRIPVTKSISCGTAGGDPVCASALATTALPSVYFPVLALL